MLTKVTQLDRLGGFRLRVRFNDGNEGVHDFTAMVGEPGSMLEPLREETYFSRVFLEFGAPTWPNGFDIAPEWLRREMAAAGELSLAPSTIQAKQSRSDLPSYHVVPDKEGRWVIKRSGTTRPSGVFESQYEAISRARELAKNRNSELVVHGKDGRIKDRRTYGSDSIASKLKTTRSRRRA
jgi:hypothetical protein